MIGLVVKLVAALIVVLVLGITIDVSSCPCCLPSQGCCGFSAIATKWIFTVSGVSDSACPECSFLVNGTTTVVLSFCDVDTTVWVGTAVIAGFCSGTADFQWKLECIKDSFFRLSYQQNGGPVPGCEWRRDYSAWNPTGSNVMTLFNPSCEGKACNNNPTTITLTPTA